MKCKGLDLGYYGMKDDEGRFCRSAITSKENSFNSVSRITIDGCNYAVGVGNMNSEVNKSNSEINKVLTLYNLVLSNQLEYCLTTGLPVAQFESQNEILRDNILTYNKSEIIYKGKQYKIKINAVKIAPQGVSALYTLNNLHGEYIVIDIGGGTINVALCEITKEGFRIVLCDTWYTGIRTIFSTIIEAVNNKFFLKLENNSAEKILINGLSVDGAQQDISFLLPILQDYVDKITEEIKLKYPYRTTPIFIVGGGAELIHKPLRKRFNNLSIFDNPRFATALGYYVYGYLKFTERGWKFD